MATVQNNQRQVHTAGVYIYALYLCSIFTVSQVLKSDGKFVYFAPEIVFFSG